MIIGGTIKRKTKIWHKFFPDGSPSDNTFMETLERDQKSFIPVTEASAKNTSQTAILVDSAGFQMWKEWRAAKQL